MKILVTPTSFRSDSDSQALKKLRVFCDNLVFNPQKRPLTEDELIPLLAGCDGFIAGVDFIARKVIESSPSLKVISRYGVGVDRVDLAAAKERGVIVCNTPGVNANAVADLTFALLLGIARKVPLLDSKTKEGEWLRSVGFELFGKTLGILGLGAVGKAVAKRAAGFSMNVLAYDCNINNEYAAANGIVPASSEEIAKEADFVSIHLPLTDETKNFVNSAFMKKMKKGAVIINTARGGILDEAAAYELLKSGQLGGLGLDVFETEPPGDSPLLNLDSVVITPHTGAHTAEAVEGMAELSVRNLIDVLSGRKCEYIVC